MCVPEELEYHGPNRELVREVMEFTFSDGIVAGVGPPEERDDITVTNDLVRAVDAAGFASDEARFMVAYKSDGILTPETWPHTGEIDWSDEEGWGGLRGSLIAEYIQTTEWYSWEHEHEAEINKCKSLAIKWTADSPMYLHDHLRQILPAGPQGPDRSIDYCREFAINEIACDMMECCKNRAFNGRTQNFWERLFAAYNQGLWPCCWLGRWPADGKLLAWRRAM
ncbi:MAG: hypothetical protein KY475_02230 [Planctomycetes bacterium]|nr:hypothetical protein [Planctomycetota bacterium]